MKQKLLVSTLAALLGASLSAPASAGIALYQDAALSVDAFGGNTGFLQTDTPTGATVLKAYLYSADIWGGGVAGDVTLNGNFLSSASGTLLPSANPVHTRVYDVTSYMKSAIEGTWGLQNHSIAEQGYTDGELLVVVYKGASTMGGTAIILDGGLATGGNTTSINFASAYTGGNAIMSLASSYSYQPANQVTVVDVVTSSTASRRLTSCAGGQDDGAGANGALITAGGVGDSTANPDPSCSGYVGGPHNNDDELYNLAQGNSANADPFLKVGDTSVSLHTNNPSFDDNVFFLGFTTAFTVSDVSNTNIVPLPPAVWLLGSGLIGLVGLVGVEKKQQRING